MAYPNALPLVASLVLAVLAIPLVLKWVPPNHFYGFRTPRTLASTDVWYRVNFFCGWAVLASSAVTIVLSAALPSSPYAFFEFAVPLVVAILATFAYLNRTA